MIELNGKKHKNKDFNNFVLDLLNKNLNDYEQLAVLEQESKVFLNQGRREKDQKYILAFKELTLKNVKDLKENTYKTLLDNENDLANKIIEQDQEIRKLKLKIKVLEEQNRNGYDYGEEPSENEETEEE